LIRSDLSDPIPSDVWSEGSLWFVVFDLKHEPQSSVVMFVIDLVAQHVIAVQRISLDLERATALVTAVQAGPSAPACAPSNPQIADYPIQ